MIIKNPYDIETLPLFYSKGPSSPSFQKSTTIVGNNNASLLRTQLSSSSGSNSFVDSITSLISLPPYTPPDFNNDHSIKCDAFGDNQNLLDSNSDSSSSIMVRSSLEYSPSFSGTSSSDGDLEEEFIYFPRFESDSDQYSIVTTESDSLIDGLFIRGEEEEEEEERGRRGRGRGRRGRRRRGRRGRGRRRRRREEGEGEEEEEEERQEEEEQGWINHYSSDQRILLVGEGDFSFSTSLAKAFGCAYNMTATSLDSEGFLRRNYKRAMSNIQSLKDRGCVVLHGVDATKMANHLLLGGIIFDRIIYNFPHAGFFHDEPRQAQICRQRALVGGFLENAEKMISENGEIHITHKSYGFFREWQLEALARSCGLRLLQELHFNLKDYPGYCTKYGFGGDKNFDCSNSRTYIFGLL
ncbi:hypothetical protein LguiA_023454 [Lonicera macranthoides]